MDSLLESGVIQRNHYITGQRSYGYRLGDKYRFDKHVRVAATDRRLLRAVTKWHQEYKERQFSRFTEVHRHLERMQYRLGIHVDRAMETLSRLPPKKNLYDSQAIIIRDLAEQRLHFSVGEYGRVQNAITSMQRDVRESLHHRNRPLMGIDIKNSQPAFLGSKLLSERTSSTTEEAARREEAGTKQKAAIYDVRFCNQNDHDSEQVNHRKSVERYCKVAFGGCLYEALMGDTSGMSEGEIKKLRDRTKKKFLTDVLAKRKSNKHGGEYQSDIEDRFRSLYAPVWSYIRRVNRDGWEHANLIRELQRAESAFVIGDVSERLRQKSSKLFFTTLHDSIYSTEDELPLVRAAFDDAFDSLGYRFELSGS